MAIVAAAAARLKFSHFKNKSNNGVYVYIVKSA